MRRALSMSTANLGSGNVRAPAAVLVSLNRTNPLLVTLDTFPVTLIVAAAW